MTLGWLKLGQVRPLMQEEPTWSHGSVPNFKMHKWQRLTLHTIELGLQDRDAILSEKARRADSNESST